MAPLVPKSRFVSCRLRREVSYLQAALLLPPGHAPLPEVQDLGLPRQAVHEVPSRHEVKQKVEVVRVLERGVLLHAKRVVDDPRHVLLLEHVIRGGQHCHLNNKHAQAGY